MPRQTVGSLASAPLTATVRRVGPRVAVALASPSAFVADLKVIFTGGRAGAPVRATVTVKLTPGPGRATPQLLDEGSGSAVRGVRTPTGYAFAPVRFPAAGSSAGRTFRITNLRGNASGVGPGGLGLPGQIVAFVSVTGSPSVHVSNAVQAVAVLKASPTRETSTTRRRPASAQRRGQ